MPEYHHNLGRAEEHTAEARRLVQRQKGLITCIAATGMDISDAEGILKVLNLDAFEHYRDTLKKRHRRL
jgi:hypothetical protein